MGLDPFPPFRPRPPWLNGDLQTLRNFLRRPVFDLTRYANERLRFPTQDGSGDVLLGDLSGPAASTKPLVILIHGLTGCSESIYMMATAAHLLRLGYPVLRLNLRGAGPARRLCAGHYHAGRSEDFRAVLAMLAPDLRRDGVMAVGYSLGGNMLLKYLGEQGGDGAVMAAASVSAPIDLKAASERLAAKRNRLFHDWLLRRMKEEALAPGPQPPESLVTAIRGARSVYQFDETVVAPRSGFAGAGDYYARSSARQSLSRIAVPTLIIHALDDPWIPGDTYAQFPWPTNVKLTSLLPRRGGHVGFHGIGSRIPWHDRCLSIFFDRALGNRANATGR